MSRLRIDLLLVWTLRFLAVLAGGIVFLVVGFLLVESFPVIKKVGISNFVTDPSWNPTEDFYNLVPMLSGTLLVTLGAVLIAAPLGVLSAVFSQYYAQPPVAGIYRRLIELLAGIPSVVYGFWGLVVLVPLIGQIQPPGPSLLAGILILSIIILPTIALITDSSFANVPDEYWRSAAASGLSKWTTVKEIVFPSAKSGVFTGVILGVARAIGETMAVLMVCGNVVQTPDSLFEPVRTLTANIALEMAYALGDHTSALFFTGTVLMAMVIILMALVEWISRRRIYE